MALVTGEHVYSIQPAAPAAMSDYNVLCAEGAKQSQTLFDAPPDTPNALRDNRGRGAYSCPPVHITDWLVAVCPPTITCIFFSFSFCCITIIEPRGVHMVNYC